MIWGWGNPKARRKFDQTKMTETSGAEVHFRIKSQTCILKVKINWQTIAKMHGDNLPIISHNNAAIIFIVRQQKIHF